MLPKPALSCTIPSVHDDTPLDCRVYHPSCLSGPGPGTLGNYSKGIDTLRRRDGLGRKIWRKKAAIVAHPYAPLGGCYDDPVVAEVVEVLLGEGWIVGTFNFRGVTGSKGATSWTAKPELHDYRSFVGFMALYMHYLQAPNLLSMRQRGEEDGSSGKIPSENVMGVGKDEDQIADSHLLLLAGYSYGSLITINLPSTITILDEDFRTPHMGSAAHDIRLRAQHLATQQNDLWKFIQMTTEAENNHPRGRHPQSGESHRAVLGGGVRIGGEESVESMRRASRELRRSVDSLRLRRSVERLRSLGRHHAASSRPDSSPAPTSVLATTRPLSQDSDSTSSLHDAKEGLETDPEGLDSTLTCYLLISPLQGVFRSLVFMSFMEKMRNHDQVLAKEEYKKLVYPNNTLAIYGDQDGFSNLKKQRAWMELMGPKTDGPLELGFKSREVKGAGHFWRERGVMGQMKSCIVEWLRALQK